VCKFDAERVELLNSHDQMCTLNNPIEIQKQSTLEEDVKPEPKDRTVPFSQWTEGLGLIEAGIMVFEHIDWNVQPAAAATGQGIEGRLLIMGRLSQQTSVLDFFKSYSGTQASPPVLLNNGDGDPDDQPTIQTVMAIYSSLIGVSINWRHLSQNQKQCILGG
jgi:hypothetical protein